MFARAFLAKLLSLSFFFFRSPLLSSFPPQVDQQLPNPGRMRYVFPNAPIIKITYNGGHKMPSWYDIHSVNGAGRFSESARGLAVSARYI